MARVVVKDALTTHDLLDANIEITEVRDHSELTGRDAVNCHPMTAITGLTEKFASTKKELEDLFAAQADALLEEVTELSEQLTDLVNSLEEDVEDFITWATPRVAHVKGTFTSLGAIKSSMDIMYVQRKGIGRYFIRFANETNDVSYVPLVQIEEEDALYTSSIIQKLTTGFEVHFRLATLGHYDVNFSCLVI